MRTSFPKIDLESTICAIATPPGQGGLGIVRVSGPVAISLVDRLFQGRKPLAGQAGFTVQHGFLRDRKTGESIDEVLVTVFRAPHSYTGEDLVEVSTHGGGVVLSRVIAALTADGANPAAPGEFTLRAFLNGRIDLTQAEAVGDLITAKTETSANAAMALLRGELQARISRARESLIAVLARVEIGIDFSDEDLPVQEADDLIERLQDAADQVTRLLEGYRRGRILRDGFTVVLAGPANVGKSTLFNRLTQDDRAIVTDIPGTTRDILREYINLDGWPVCLVDTAGLRESLDLVESIGIGKTAEALIRADGILWMIDANLEYEDQKPPMEVIAGSIPYLVVANKIDKHPTTDPRGDSTGEWSLAKGRAGLSPIPLSAKDGTGMDRLLAEIRGWIAGADKSRSAETVAINDRHRAALLRGQESLNRAIDALRGNRDLEIVAFETKSASATLGEITGETTTEEILGEIFGSFCVGK